MSAIPEEVRRAAENFEREWQLPPLSILDFLNELNDNGYGIAKIDSAARVEVSQSHQTQKDEK